jgi:hypothetical protein
MPLRIFIKHGRSFVSRTAKHITQFLGKVH